ncbi:MAG: hypothetical protein AB1724_19880, partial [Thermodesulfobacteriota bacterium]
RYFTLLILKDLLEPRGEVDKLAGKTRPFIFFLASLQLTSDVMPIKIMDNSIVKTTINDAKFKSGILVQVVSAFFFILGLGYRINTVNWRIENKIYDPTPNLDVLRIIIQVPSFTFVVGLGTCWWVFLKVRSDKHITNFNGSTKYMILFERFATILNILLLTYYSFFFFVLWVDSNLSRPLKEAYYNWEINNKIIESMISTFGVTFFILSRLLLRLEIFELMKLLLPILIIIFSTIIFIQYVKAKFTPKGILLNITNLTFAFVFYYIGALLSCTDF